MLPSIPLLLAPINHILAIHPSRRPPTINPASGNLIPSLVVHVFEVEGVDVAGEVAEAGEEDVDEDVGAAAGYEEDA